LWTVIGEKVVKVVRRVRIRKPTTLANRKEGKIYEAGGYAGEI
jgi:hypothetical protein